MSHIHRLPVAISFLALAALPQVAEAHPLSYGAVNTTLIVDGSQLELVTNMPQSLGAVAPDEAGKLALYTQYFNENLTISQAHDGTTTPCTFAMNSVFVSSTSSQAVFNGTFTCAATVTSLDSLSVESTLFSEFFSDFNHFVLFDMGGKEWSLVFTPTLTEYPQNIKAQYLGTEFDRFLAVAKDFVWRGMLHIWTGYDHILFLISIILLLRSLKKILLLVTSFTIAHSITLILAGLHIITVPERIVEPLIALTIAYMAIRNIWILRTESKQEEGDESISERWVTTFGFGLIHGLGFASALSATDIPAAFFVPSLVIFNVGIEIGQFSIIAVVLPLLMHSDRLHHRKKIFMIASAIIALLALIWAIERVIGVCVGVVC